MTEITAKEVESLVNKGKALNIIDVREVDEVADGKIPGAVNIPLGHVESRIDELDKSEKYIMVCRSGGRSGRAAEFLDNQGYNVINMQGGMLSWKGEVC
ncbi:rhodanese [Virgibacillus indicus]|uniref:Rhodanese n=1 Tax=Virgibacillus indicus TaxID=2024554 RepID=A0A265N9A2_9BACI|nr:rhodanese-like domain-containing protein [Virgibacillus indicus]OZU88610.1 rhodanese [Virgibacillus indicus]